MPWPPLNEISSSAPESGLIPNTGTSTATARRSPSAYCPKLSVAPKSAWVAERRQISRTLGMCFPSRIAAKTTLMSRPGSFAHTATVDGPKTPSESRVPESNSLPSTCGPISRPIIPAVTAFGT